MRHSPLPYGKERLLSAFWERLSFGDYQRRARLKGIDVEIACDLGQFIQRHVYFFGHYEPESTRYWSQLARHAEVIFDLGANFGIYSLLAAASNPRARIYAFEPTPEMFEKLSRNIEGNHFENVFPLQAAVGATSGKGFLHRCSGSDGGNEGMNYVSGETAAESDVGVNLISLDNFCRQQKIAKIDLLKMDIEGGELDALRGASELLDSQQIDCILFEFSDWAAQRAGHSVEDIPKLLGAAGYSLFQLRRGKLKPFDRGNLPNVTVIARPSRST